MKVILTTGAVITGRQINIDRWDYIAIKTKNETHYLPRSLVRDIKIKE